VLKEHKERKVYKVLRVDLVPKEQKVLEVYRDLKVVKEA
jgi:hypothetical protein